MEKLSDRKFSGLETNSINLKTNHNIDMSTTYLSVDYFPLTVNFFDRDAIELAEAKYGIRVDGAVCKLLCKIFKEGYYIPWGEEQSLIFARK